MSIKRIEDDGPDVQGAGSVPICAECPDVALSFDVRTLARYCVRHAPRGFCAAISEPNATSTVQSPSVTVTGWPFQLTYPATPQPQPGISPHAPGVVPDDRFASLRQEMDAAFAQAASGKGMERHGDGGRFEDQTTIRMARELGTAFPVGQAVKKLLEGERMMKAGNVAGALREWHGAMVYAAMACIVGRRS